MNRKWMQCVAMSIIVSSGLSIVAKTPTVPINSNSKETEVAQKMEDKGVLGIPRSEVHEATLDYKVVQEQVLLPFRAFMSLIGVEAFKWEGCVKPSIYGYITLEMPDYFYGEYYGNLLRGIQEWESVFALPQSLQGILKVDDSEILSHTESLQHKGIEVTINSEGRQTGFMFYDYENIDGCLYVPSTLLKGFGLQEAKLDKSQNKAVVTYKTQKELRQEQEADVASIKDIIRTLKPEEILSLWIRAQQTRSGALQYTLLADTLQPQVLEEAKGRGWVTGGSSPTLLGGKVTIQQIGQAKQDEQLEGETIKYTVSYESMLQGKVYEILAQEITLMEYEDEKGSYWRIANVTGDVGYYTFHLATYFQLI